MDRRVITIIALLAAVALLTFAINALLTKSLAARAGASGRSRIARSYGKLPLSFEANQGQTNSQVKFLSRGNGYTLFSAPDQSVLVLDKTVLRMKIDGANPNAAATGVNELPGKTNYVIGNDPAKWRSKVPSFARVRYTDIYDGIDVVYYGNQRELEYDFVVAPGANPRVIALDFQGAEQLSIDSGGDLVIQTGGGEIRQHKPVVYQEIDGVKRPVAGEYRLRANRQVGFEVAAYDVTQALVIDPVLSYSNYLGGNDRDAPISVAVDLQGNPYITGWTTSADFPINGAFDTICGTNFTVQCNSDPVTNKRFADVFITKLDPTGTYFLYSTYVGGHDLDVGTDIAVDDAGCAYVTGFTLSTTTFPITAPLSGGLQGGGGSDDIFVLKMDPTGSFPVYSTLLGGTGAEGTSAIAIDTLGNAYITGTTNSTNFPTTPGAFQPAFQGTYFRAFVTKISPPGIVPNQSGPSLVYSTFLGCGEAVAEDIALGPGGEAYVAGITSCIQTTNSAYQTTIAYGFDGFVTKLNRDGSGLVFSTYLGGNGTEIAGAVAIDAGGNVYVAGATSSTNFPGVSPSSIQSAPGGASDAFVTKLNSTGSSIIYSTLLGGSDGDYADGVGLIVRDGRAYVVSDTSSNDFPGTAASPVQNTFGGSVDLFLTELNSQGSAIVHSTYLGGSGHDTLGVVFPSSQAGMGHNSGVAGHPLAMDNLGNIYVIGQTDSTDLRPFTNGNFLHGPSDGFIVKLSPVVEVSAALTAPPSVTTGYTGSYSITVTNAGPDEAVNVKITDPLPSHVKYVSAQSPYGKCSHSNQTMTCIIPTLVPGGQAVITLQAVFNDLAVVTNTVTVSANGDGNTANNQSSGTTSIVKTCAGDVTSYISVHRSSIPANSLVQHVMIQNVSTKKISGPVSLVLDNGAGFSQMTNRTGTTACVAPLGNPYKDFNVGADLLLSPGETAWLSVEFSEIGFNRNALSYAPRILAGAGSR